MKKEKKIPDADASDESTGMQEVAEEHTKSQRDFVAKKLDRITMGSESLSRIDAWVKQVEGARPAVEITRRDLVEWLILKHAEALSPSEVKELSEAHYNELRFLQYAIRELKVAKAQGKTVHLQDMVGALPILTRPKERTPRVKKKVEADFVADTAPSTEYPSPSPIDDPKGLQP